MKACDCNISFYTVGQYLAFNAFTNVTDELWKPTEYVRVGNKTIFSSKVISTKAKME